MLQESLWTLKTQFLLFLCTKSGDKRRRSVADDGTGVNGGRWSSLHPLTLEHLIPERRAWSGEELRMTETEARKLSLPKNQSCSILPHYGSTGNCHVCPQNARLWKQEHNHSAPAVFSPDVCSGKRKHGTSHQSIVLIISLSLTKQLMPKGRRTSTSFLLSFIFPGSFHVALLVLFFFFFYSNAKRHHFISLFFCLFVF